jgi:hypothetical protein
MASPNPIQGTAGPVWHSAQDIGSLRDGPRAHGSGAASVSARRTHPWKSPGKGRCPRGRLRKALFEGVAVTLSVDVTDRQTQLSASAPPQAPSGRGASHPRQVAHAAGSLGAQRARQGGRVGDQEAHRSRCVPSVCLSLHPSACVLSVHSSTLRPAIWPSLLPPCVPALSIHLFFCCLSIHLSVLAPTCVAA